MYELSSRPDRQASYWKADELDDLVVKPGALLRFAGEIPQIERSKPPRLAIGSNPPRELRWFPGVRNSPGFP